MRKKIDIKYICDFCGCSSRGKEYMEEHEPKCVKNPVMRACPTCANYPTNAGSCEVHKQYGVCMKCELWASAAKSRLLQPELHCKLTDSGTGPN